MTAQNGLTTIGYKVSDIPEVKNVAPSAFSKVAAPERSEHYSFVSTEELLGAFDKLGWKPYSAKQNGQSPYARHFIRLENESLGYLDLRGDKVRPQIIVDNSHNGGSRVQIHLGLFRLVCSNGLVVAMPGMHTSVKLRHMGVDFAELKNLMETVTTQYNMVAKRIEEMKNIQLDQFAAEQFVIKAMARREAAYFISKEDGSILTEKVLKSIKPAEILKSTREADNDTNLWNIFNIVQEKMVKGEFERKSLGTGRVSKPRPLTGATRNLQFNKVLWSIAEEYLGTPADAAMAGGKVTYTSSKGKKMEVEILEKLADGNVMIKSGSLTFAVKETQLS